MRKKTIDYWFDTVFWYVIYFLPILVFLFTILADMNQLTFVFEQFRNVLVNDNIIYDSLTSIFGLNGVLPLFDSIYPILFFTWFVSIYLAHLLVDFILFIPRLCHKFMNKFTQGD